MTMAKRRVNGGKWWTCDLPFTKASVQKSKTCYLEIFYPIVTKFFVRSYSSF